MLTAKKLGKLIQEARKKAGLSQYEVAAACGLGIRFVRELERGKPSCQLEKALLVAHMLGISFEIVLPSFMPKNPVKLLKRPKIIIPKDESSA